MPGHPPRPAPPPRPLALLPRPLALLPWSLALLPVLMACGDGGSSGGIAVTATDSTCEVATTTLRPGSHTFTVTNDGDRATEVYVYGRSGGAFSKVLSEVEDVGPGTSRDLTVELGAGSYEVACKPGQRGDGIRQRVTVTGGAR